VYDNTTLAVARILGDGRRRRTRVFSELQSHYLFEDRFGRPGKENDKRLARDSVRRCHQAGDPRPQTGERRAKTTVGTLSLGVCSNPRKEG
jgi:transposase